jgi:6-phosphofructokinase 1
MSKRIGILTSGGDCAGLNAVIRAVIQRAVVDHGWELIGIREGTSGLMERPLKVEQLGPDMLTGDLLRRGGTLLGSTNYGDPFAFPEADGRTTDRSQEIVEGFRQLALDALIGIGGDGSLHILRRLAAKGGIKLIGIPKTIDNDIGLTETSIGFDTAVTVATEALDRLQPTAASHSRVMVVEVMGRDAGHIALAAGIAGGADVILIPEVSYDFDVVGEHLTGLRRAGRNFALVIVAEAVPTESGERRKISHAGGDPTYGGIGHYVAQRIGEATGAITRAIVLGHLQRGGSPTWHDRLIASAFGVRAVDLIAEGKFDRMVAWRAREIIDVPLSDAIASYRNVDVDGALVRTARGIGICLGDRPAVRASDDRIKPRERVAGRG